MSIRHAILGLLSEQQMHGYRLKGVFAERVSPLWGLTTGQVYQSLAALERTGLVESRGERAGRRPARRVYAVTERGRAELDAWLQRPPSSASRPFREDLLIRLLFLRSGDTKALLESLARQEHEATLDLARVARLRSDPSAPDAIDVAGAFLDGMTHHLDADLKLLQRCREEVERWVEAREQDTIRDTLSVGRGADACAEGNGVAVVAITTCAVRPPTAQRIRRASANLTRDPEARQLRGRAAP